MERPLDQALDGRADLLPEPRDDRAAPRPAHRARRSSATACSPTSGARPSPPSSSSSRSGSALSRHHRLQRAGPGAGAREGPGPRRPAPRATLSETQLSAGARAARRSPPCASSTTATSSRRWCRCGRRATASAGVGAVVVGTHVTERLEARLRGISPGLPGVQAAQAAQEPDQGHLHPALPADDAHRRLLRSRGSASTWRAASPSPSSSSRRARARWPPATSATRCRCARTTRSASLVDSFNRMTDDLAAVQAQARGGLPRPAGQAHRAGGAPPLHRDRAGGDHHRRGLVRRRWAASPRSTGAAERMFGLDRRRASWADASRRSSAGPSTREIAALVQRMARRREGTRRPRAAPAARRRRPSPCSPPPPRCAGPTAAYVGVVVVFDDLTELLKAQRLAAWREVAQRIAHEIKNPLTPIQLSAQRLRRRLARRRSPARSSSSSTECTETIIQEVDGLKRLVDEFSRFARMPALVARPDRPARRSLEGVVVLYRESHPALTIRPALSADLPLARGRSRPDQARRAQPRRQRGGGGGPAPARWWWRPIVAARAPAACASSVSDDGPGIAAEDKERALRAVLLDEGHRHGARAAHRPPRSSPSTAARSASRTTCRAAAASSSSCPASRVPAAPVRGLSRWPASTSSSSTTSGRSRRRCGACSRTRAIGSPRWARGAEALAALAATRRPTSSSSTSGCRAWTASRPSPRSSALRPEPAVVMISGHGTIETAVKATKLGAYDFIEKPLSLEKTLLTATPRARARRGSSARTATCASSSSAARRSSARARVDRATCASRSRWRRRPTAACSSTARTAAARSWWRAPSTRCPRGASGPFVEVNCAAIPEELIESELFGHERGAFTGAVARRRGKFEAADGGTLFLDEIGDMSLKTQAKVLRALEEQAFERVGGKETRPGRRARDRRLQPGSARSCIAQGRFREDLFYRLNVIPIEVPPLRARKEDMPAARRALHRALLAPRTASGSRRSRCEALAYFLAYDWPGNVRELRNMVERLVIMAPARRHRRRGPAAAAPAQGDAPPAPTRPREQARSRRRATASSAPTSWPSCAPTTGT